MARHPARISLADVVEALEGPFNLVDCVSDDACCAFTAVCPTHDPMQMVHLRFKHFMTGLTLDEILGLPAHAVPLRMVIDEDAYLP